jgi:hypothetical protein
MGIHVLSAEQKLRRVTESQSLLTILATLVEKNFQGIIQDPEKSLGAIQEAWIHFTFEDVHKVFKSRKE